MYNVEPICVVCGISLSSMRDYLCVSCAKKYPRPWPDWLDFLVRDVMRERLDALRSSEVSFADCPEAEIIAYGEP